MSFIYEKCKEKLMTAGIDLVNDTINCALVDAGDYTPDVDVDEFFSDIPPAGVISFGALNNATVVGKSFNADDKLLSSVTGDDIEMVVIYKDTGSSATSPLIAMIDSGTGLPFTPNGGSVNIIWGASIFDL